LCADLRPAFHRPSLPQTRPWRRTTLYHPSMDDPEAAEWRPLLSAAAVAPGEIAPIDVGDLELVAWRTTAGDLTVCDARCPHQWSHLAFEGVVDGDELLCTAHFWRFDRQGHGTKANLAGRRDEKSGVPVYRSRVRAGKIEVDLSSADLG
jgi:phenylpropionate dioxygenase-like ring-hydroxylating dioxygenase large terminal subunit